MTAEEHNKISKFFKEEYSTMVGYVKKRFDDTTAMDGEDIVQEVMTNLFTRGDISAPIENLAAYIYRALRNRIVDSFRKRDDDISLDAPAGSPETGSLLDIMEDLRYEGAAAYDREQIRKKVFQALDSLKPEQRLVIIATELEGKSFKELSRELEIPMGTLLARKSRALKTVRETLTSTTEETEA